MERTLEAALAAWRRHPTAALADHLDHLSDELTGRSPAVSEADWSAVCARRQPTELGPLLAALPPLDHPRWGTCVDQLAGWPRDPRLTTALNRQLLQHLPRSDAHSVWRRVLGLVAWVGDVRAATWLSDLLAELDGPFTVGRSLHLRAQELIIFLANRPGQPCGKPLRLPSVSTPLLQAPTDPTQRLILADQLLERGDARGELIVLQSLEAPRAQQRRRSRALVREYGRAWLGRLGPALKAQGLRFEHGFVVEGRLSGYRALRQLTGAPEWRAIRALDLRELHRRAPRAPVLLEFLTHPVMQSLERVDHFPSAEVWALLRASRPISITTLGVSGWLAAYALDELKRCRALPKLTTLTLNGATQ